MIAAMAESSRATLRNLLLTGYDELAKRLTFRLGSADLARDALQDTYLRLERTPQIGPVRSPKSYLLRMALNIAANRRIAENRLLTFVEAEALLQVADDVSDPARAVEARSEIEALKRALAELPARRREMALAAWVDDLSQKDIAQRFGVSVRTVQLELKAALAFCALHRG